jgi:hypothetical protein
MLLAKYADFKLIKFESDDELVDIEIRLESELVYVNTLKLMLMIPSSSG